MDSEENEFEVEKILEKIVRNGRTKYLIKWKGYSSEENTWEPEKNLHRGLIEDFEKSRHHGDGWTNPGVQRRKQGSVQHGTPPRRIDSSDIQRGGSHSSKSSRKRSWNDRNSTASGREKLNENKARKTTASNQAGGTVSNVKDIRSYRGQVINAIVGTKEVNGVIFHLVKWDRDGLELELVPASVTSVLNPMAVMAFYINRMSFSSPDILNMFDSQS